MIKGRCHCGAVGWEFEGDPGAATACNCTICRRYGTLWGYDWEGERIRVLGKTVAYMRAKPSIEFHFCPGCGGVAFWRAAELDQDGRRRIAVNLRLAEDPGEVAHLPVEHFDGLDTFDDLGQDGRTVAHMWF